MFCHLLLINGNGCITVVEEWILTMFVGVVALWKWVYNSSRRMDFDYVCGSCATLGNGCITVVEEWTLTMFVGVVAL